MTPKEFSSVQAETVYACLGWLRSYQTQLSDEAIAFLKQSEKDWNALIAFVKPAPAPAGTVAAPAAPAPASAVLTQTREESAPAPAPATPAAQKPANVTPIAPKPPFPTTLRPAFDTRTLFPPQQKLAGQ